MELTLSLIEFASNTLILNCLSIGARPITIGNGVWLGGNVVVLPGVTIGDRAVIGAGSVVTKDIPPDTVAVGNPCKVIKTNIN